MCTCVRVHLWYTVTFICSLLLTLHAWVDSTDQCNSGCINTWLGDRYCDNACRVKSCGYDAGDCGTENWNELFSIQVKKSGGDYITPLGTTAMYLNFSDVFLNGSIEAADYTPCQLVRTAIVAQKHKTLSITFTRNVTLTTVNFTISGMNGHGIKTTVSYVHIRYL